MFLDGEDSTSLMQLCGQWDHDYRRAVIDGTWTAVPRSEPDPHRRAGRLGDRQGWPGGGRDADDPEAVLTAPGAWSLRMLLRKGSAARRARQRTS